MGLDERGSREEEKMFFFVIDSFLTFSDFRLISKINR